MQAKPLSIELHLGLLKISRMRGVLAILKLLRKMLTRILIFSRRSNTSATDGDYDDGASSLAEDLPEDVKEGHFVVHTVDHGEHKRFIIELGYLAHPGFLKLLEKAEDEFGFRSEGVLVIPCGPNELQKILENRKAKMG